MSVDPGHVDFYYDVVCPFAYLASTQVQGLAVRTGATLHYRPMLLGGVFVGNGAPANLSAGFSPQRARHNLADMHRWADTFGVTLRVPASHPQRTILTMRIILAAGEEKVTATDALYRAYWVDGVDMNDGAALAAYLEAAGMPGPAWVEAAGTPAIKDALRAATDAAVAAGVFGAPTFVVGDALFWGQDRLHFVERALRDPSWAPHRDAPEPPALTRGVA